MSINKVLFNHLVRMGYSIEFVESIIDLPEDEMARRAGLKRR